MPMTLADFLAQRERLAPRPSQLALPQHAGGQIDVGGEWMPASSLSPVPPTQEGRTIGSLPLPGIISGFGGGTWNTDGMQATPVQRTVGDVIPARLAPSGPSGPLINQLAPNIRHSFDYDRAADTILEPQKKPSTLQAIGQILLPALMAYRGNQHGANMMLSSMAERKERDRRFRQETIADLIKERARDAHASDDAYYRDTAPFSSGRDRLRWNPETGKSEMLHEGEQDFEAYASALGLVPGSDAYYSAMEDYVLRANGPAAFERNKQLDDYRTSNDVRMEKLRHSNRSQLEGERQGNRVSLRQTPTYRDLNPRQSGGSHPQGYSAPVTVRSPAEAQKLAKGTQYRTPDGKVFTR